MPDKEVRVAVPEERVPEFYAWFAAFLVAEPGSPPPLGRHGRRGPGRSRHHEPAQAWSADDADQAAWLYNRLAPPARALLDLLIEAPGERFGGENLARRLELQKGSSRSRRNSCVARPLLPPPQPRASRIHRGTHRRGHRLLHGARARRTVRRSAQARGGDSTSRPRPIRPRQTRLTLRPGFRYSPSERKPRRGPVATPRRTAWCRHVGARGSRAACALTSS